MNSNWLPIQVWVLKQKVEDDYDEYLFYTDPDTGEPVEQWPYKDSTIATITALENEGIRFDPLSKSWNE